MPRDSVAIKENIMEEILREIFSTMVPLPLEIDPRRDPLPPEFSGVTAIVNISSENVKFVVVLQASEALALKIFGAMVGEQRTEWSSEIGDGMGEVANMIAGNLKTAMGIEGMSLSIPSVINGKDYNWNAPGVAMIHEERFFSAEDAFTVRVAKSK